MEAGAGDSPTPRPGPEAGSPPPELPSELASLLFCERGEQLAERAARVFLDKERILRSLEHQRASADKAEHELRCSQREVSQLRVQACRAVQALSSERLVASRLRARVTALEQEVQQQRRPQAAQRPRRGAPPRKGAAAPAPAGQQDSSSPAAPQADGGEVAALQQALEETRLRLREVGHQLQESLRRESQAVAQMEQELRSSSPAEGHTRRPRSPTPQSPEEVQCPDSQAYIDAMRRLQASAEAQTQRAAQLEQQLRERDARLDELQAQLQRAAAEQVWLRSELEAESQRARRLAQQLRRAAGSEQRWLLQAAQSRRQVLALQEEQTRRELEQDLRLRIDQSQKRVGRLQQNLSAVPVTPDQRMGQPEQPGGSAQPGGPQPGGPQPGANALLQQKVAQLEQQLRRAGQSEQELRERLDSGTRRVAQLERDPLPRTDASQNQGAAQHQPPAASAQKASRVELQLQHTAMSQPQLPQTAAEVQRKTQQQAQQQAQQRTQQQSRPPQEPAVAQQGPAAGRQEPAAGQQEPAARQQGSAVGQQEPAAGHHKPAAGKHEPATGQHEPAQQGQSAPAGGPQQQGLSPQQQGLTVQEQGPASQERGPGAGQRTTRRSRAATTIPPKRAKQDDLRTPRAAERRGFRPQREIDLVRQKSAQLEQKLEETRDALHAERQETARLQGQTQDAQSILLPLPRQASELATCELSWSYSARQDSVPQLAELPQPMLRLYAATQRKHEAEEKLQMWKKHTEEVVYQPDDHDQEMLDLPEPCWLGTSTSGRDIDSVGTRMKEFLRTVADVWRRKSGTLMDELCDNLVVPDKAAAGDPPSTEMRLALAVRDFVRKDGASAARVLLMKLYSMEGFDVDSLMGFDDVPKDGKDEYRKQHQDKYKRNPRVDGKFPRGIFPLGKNEKPYPDGKSPGGAPKALFRIWNWAMRTVFNPEGANDEEQLQWARTELQKWIKTIVALTAAAESIQEGDRLKDSLTESLDRVDTKKHNKAELQKQARVACDEGFLYRAFNLEDEAQWEKLVDLKEGELIPMMQPTSTSVLKEKAKKFLRMYPVLYKVRLPPRGTLVWTTSQYPQEAEILLPADMILRVTGKPEQLKRTAQVGLPKVPVSVLSKLKDVHDMRNVAVDESGFSAEEWKVIRMLCKGQRLLKIDNKAVKEDEEFSKFLKEHTAGKSHCSVVMQADYIEIPLTHADEAGDLARDSEWMSVLDGARKELEDMEGELARLNRDADQREKELESETVEATEEVKAAVRQAKDCTLSMTQLQQLCRAYYELAQAHTHGQEQLAQEHTWFGLAPGEHNAQEHTCQEPRHALQILPLRQSGEDVAELERELCEARRQLADARSKMELADGLLQHQGGQEAYVPDPEQAPKANQDTAVAQQVQVVVRQELAQHREAQEGRAREIDASNQDLAQLLRTVHGDRDGAHEQLRDELAVLKEKLGAAEAELKHLREKLEERKAERDGLRADLKGARAETMAAQHGKSDAERAAADRLREREEAWHLERDGLDRSAKGRQEELQQEVNSVRQQLALEQEARSEERRASESLRQQLAGAAGVHLEAMARNQTVQDEVIARAALEQERTRVFVSEELREARRVLSEIRRNASADYINDNKRFPVYAGHATVTTGLPVSRPPSAPRARPLGVSLKDQREAREATIKVDVQRLFEKGKKSDPELVRTSLQAAQLRGFKYGAQASGAALYFVQHRLSFVRKLRSARGDIDRALGFLHDWSAKYWDSTDPDARLLVGSIDRQPSDRQTAYTHISSAQKLLKGLYEDNVLCSDRLSLGLPAQPDDDEDHEVLRQAVRCITSQAASPRSSPGRQRAQTIGERSPPRRPADYQGQTYGVRRAFR
eukprot:TRINITY_DN35029_c0_g1_i2.p1 TRINITY_DN35029_c0_g1~~TRINITY_DN35029_c0_g1_i2.p1  ORF type:complete len:1853 (+),score=304.67 TRINITY_DN35029_c0_g1_i2:87-5645(+)